MLVNISIGVLIGVLIFSIGKLILGKNYHEDQKQKGNLNDPRYFKRVLNISTEVNSLKENKTIFSVDSETALPISTHIKLLKQQNAMVRDRITIKNSEDLH